MASPKTNHQRVLRKLNFELEFFLRNNPKGELFFAPYDVHFDEKNVVQPDLLYISIARKDIIQDYIEGAPDFVVEVLSPTNSKAEMLAKMELYGKYDVIEYWIVMPKAESVEVYHNHEKKMQLFVEVGIEDTIKSVAIEGFELEVRRIFE
jgi:Uma2 family endonuclease